MQRQLDVGDVGLEICDLMLGADLVPFIRVTRPARQDQS